MEVVAYECEECHALKRTLEAYQIHINKHRDVEAFNQRYPLSEVPVFRDDKWVTEILGYSGEGPYQELMERFNRWCIYCRMEFPNLLDLINHKCKEKQHELQ